MKLHKQEIIARSIGLTHLDLALKLRVSERTVARYFRGENKNMDTLKRKCMELCIDQAIRRHCYVKSIQVKKKEC